jgi:hypothetical protein
VTTPRWPDVNLVFRDLIAPLVGGVDNVGLETPDDLITRDWYVRARRIDGGNDQLNDFPVVEVDTFAPTYTVAEQLAEQIRQRLTAPRASTILDRIDCPRGPVELPWGDGRMRRLGALYEATTRRRGTV